MTSGHCWPAATRRGRRSLQPSPGRSAAEAQGQLWAARAGAQPQPTGGPLRAGHHTGRLSVVVLYPVYRIRIGPGQWSDRTLGKFFVVYRQRYFWALI